MVIAMQPSHPQYAEFLKEGKSTTFSSEPLEFPSLEMCKHGAQLVVTRETQILRENKMQFVYIKCQEVSIPREGI